MKSAYLNSGQYNHASHEQVNTENYGSSQMNQNMQSNLYEVPVFDEKGPPMTGYVHPSDQGMMASQYNMLQNDPQALGLGAHEYQGSVPAFDMQQFQEQRVTQTQPNYSFQNPNYNDANIYRQDYNNQAYQTYAMNQNMERPLKNDDAIKADPDMSPPRVANTKTSQPPKSKKQPTMNNRFNMSMYQNFLRNRQLNLQKGYNANAADITNQETSSEQELPPFSTNVHCDQTQNSQSNFDEQFVMPAGAQNFYRQTPSPKLLVNQQSNSPSYPHNEISARKAGQKSPNSVYNGRTKQSIPIQTSQFPQMSGNMNDSYAGSYRSNSTPKRGRGNASNITNDYKRPVDTKTQDITNEVFTRLLISFLNRNVGQITQLPAIQLRSDVRPFPLNLYNLFTSVLRFGSYQTVTQNSQWEAVTRQVLYFNDDLTTGEVNYASSQLRMIYEMYLAPVEQIWLQTGCNQNIIDFMSSICNNSSSVPNVSNFTDSPGHQSISECDQMHMTPSSSKQPTAKKLTGDQSPYQNRLSEESGAVENGNLSTGQNDQIVSKEVAQDSSNMLLKKVNLMCLLGHDIFRLRPRLPPLKDIGALNVFALTRSLQSQLDIEMNFAIEILLMLSAQPEIFLPLSECEDLLEVIIDAIYDEIDVLCSSARQKTCDESEFRIPTGYLKQVFDNAIEESLHMPQNLSSTDNDTLRIHMSSQRLCALLLLLSNLSLSEMNQDYLVQSGLALPIVLDLIRFISICYTFEEKNKHCLLQNYQMLLRLIIDLSILFSNIAQGLRLDSTFSANIVLRFFLIFSPFDPFDVSDIENPQCQLPSFHYSSSKGFIPYLPAVIDSMAKVLSREEPNKRFFEIVLSSANNENFEILTTLFAMTATMIPSQEELLSDDVATILKYIDILPTIQHALIAADKIIEHNTSSELAYHWMCAGEGYAGYLLRFMLTFNTTVKYRIQQMQMSATASQQNISNQIADDVFNNMIVRSAKIISNLSEKAQNSIFCISTDLPSARNDSQEATEGESNRKSAKLTIAEKSGMIKQGQILAAILSPLLHTRVVKTMLDALSY